MIRRHNSGLTPVNATTVTAAFDEYTQVRSKF